MDPREGFLRWARPNADCVLPRFSAQLNHPGVPAGERVMEWQLRSSYSSGEDQLTRLSDMTYDTGGIWRVSGYDETYPKTFW